MTPAEHAATVREALWQERHIPNGQRVRDPHDALDALVALAERATEPKVFRLEREARLAAEERATELERERDEAIEACGAYARQSGEQADEARKWRERAERAETALRELRQEGATALARGDVHITEFVEAFLARAALGETP